MRHERKCLFCLAAKEPAVHADRSEEQSSNLQAADNPVAQVNDIQAFITNSMDFGKFDWKGNQLETLMMGTDATGGVKDDDSLKKLNFKDESAWVHSEEYILTITPTLYF